MVKKRRSNTNSKRIIKRKNSRTMRKRVRGGEFFGLPTWNSSLMTSETTYPLNSYNDDPSWPPIGNLSARNINIGGSRRRIRNKRNKRSINKNNRKIKGGTFLGTGAPAWINPSFSFASSYGAGSSASLVTGSGIPLTSIGYDNSNPAGGRALV